MNESDPHRSTVTSVRVSTRARHMNLAIYPGGRVVLTVPFGTTALAIDTFVRRKATWIAHHVRRLLLVKTLPVHGRRAYLEHKEAARVFVHERLAYWNTFYGFSYGRVSIKNQKSVWGTCSHKGNLNFNYAIVLLPRELADYVIVHELCHLQEHNHGRGFWNLVARACPDYKRLKAELNKYTLRCS